MGLYILSILFILAGLNHFLNPKFYVRIIPPIFKFKKIINWISGVAEIILGVGLLSEYQSESAWGLVVLLVLVFPANVYHLMQKGAGMKVPIWILWLRLPLQLPLIWWAWLYT